MNLSLKRIEKEMSKLEQISRKNDFFKVSNDEIKVSNDEILDSAITYFTKRRIIYTTNHRGEDKLRTL